MTTRAVDKDKARYDAGAQVTREDFICLHRNENLFAGEVWTEQRIADALRGISLDAYPDPTYMPLRSDLADLYGVEPENVFVGNGSDEVLSDLFGFFRSSYDEVHLLDTCFKVYYLLAARFGFRVGTLGGNTFETGRIDGPGPDALSFVDSPNAITGRAAEPSDLRSLAEPKGSFLVWDNAYGEFGEEELPTPWAENVILVRSFSKFYALAGARVGYCIASREVVTALMDAKDVFNVNMMGEALARAALRRIDEFRELVAETRACRALLVSGLEDLGFEVHPPAANYVFATHAEVPASIIQAGLHAAGIAVRRFEGPLTGNSIRITVAPRPTVEVFTDRLSKVLKE